MSGIGGSAPSSQPPPARGGRVSTATALPLPLRKGGGGRGEETPFRRFVSEFAASHIALAALVAFVLIVARRDLRAAHRAAESVRSVHSSTSWTVGCRQVPHPGPATPTWLGTDDQGRDMFSGHPVRPAHLAWRRRRLRIHRVHLRHRARPVRRLYRGTHRCRDHASGRSAALLPLHPCRADDPRHARQRRDERLARAGNRRMGLLHAHCAGFSLGGTPARIHRSGGMPRTAETPRHLFRHLLPNCCRR